VLVYPVGEKLDVTFNMKCLKTDYLLYMCEYYNFNTLTYFLCFFLLVDEMQFQHAKPVTLRRAAIIQMQDTNVRLL